MFQQASLGDACCVLERREHLVSLEIHMHEHTGPNLPHV